MGSENGSHLERENKVEERARGWSFGREGEVRVRDGEVEWLAFRRSLLPAFFGLVLNLILVGSTKPSRTQENLERYVPDPKIPSLTRKRKEEGSVNDATSTTDPIRSSTLHSSFLASKPLTKPSFVNQELYHISASSHKRTQRIPTKPHPRPKEPKSSEPAALLPRSSSPSV